MQCVLVVSFAIGLLMASCSREEARSGRRDQAGPAYPTSEPGGDRASAAAPNDDDLPEARRALLAELQRTGIRDERVLAALGRVPRHRLVPPEMRAFAYEDRPLPIGHEQTISQPYIVALMSQLADVRAGEKVLEIGTGSGYQAAVLAELGADVYSIEVVPPLGERARRVLDDLGYGARVRTRIGDGYRGWPEEAPFDAIVITAAPPEIPKPLQQQLALGGKLVVPVGKGTQELVVLTKQRDGLARTTSIPVRFVPMTGEAQQRR